MTRRRTRDCRIVWVTGLMTLLLAAAALIGCGRGRPTERPPIHLNPDMDRQPKYISQSASEHFADGAAMRQPVQGTVPRGFLREGTGYFTGRDENGEYVRNNPRDMTMQLLERGRERYDIYCSPCHSRVGDGKGIMINRGYVPPPTFHIDYLRDTLDGYFFDVITSGVRNMPAYAHQINADDRWSIIAYLRALQRSRAATIDDIPEAMRGTIEKAGQ